MLLDCVSNINNDYRLNKTEVTSVKLVLLEEWQIKCKLQVSSGTEMILSGSMGDWETSGDDLHMRVPY